MALLVCPALGHKMISQTWPRNRKTWCEYSTDYAALLTYGDTLYGKRLHVLSSMVQSNCLGERAPPSPAFVILHCWVRRFVNNVYSLHRLSAILKVEYGGIDMPQDPMENFNRCARCYTANKGKSRTDAGQQLLVRMYVWVLQQYKVCKAYRIHRHLICLSFFWAAFTKGVTDRRRQNEKEQVSPRLDKWGHWVHLRRFYNPDKIRQGITGC